MPAACLDLQLLFASFMQSFIVKHVCRVQKCAL